MTIAVTGASGFVGSTLIPLLLDEGHSLRLLSHAHPYEGTEKERGELRQVPGNLLQEESLMPFLSGAEVVIHLASMISIDREPSEVTYQLNTEGTQALLNAAQRSGVKRFIYLSSIKAFQQTPLEQAMDEGRAYLTQASKGYDLSKAVAQAMVLERHGPKMACIVLAPSGIIGPMDRKPSPMGKALLKMYKGKLPALFPGGIDLVDVRDVAQATVKALTLTQTGQAYLLSGQWISLKDLSQEVGQISGRSLSIPVLPVWLIHCLLPLINLWSKISGTPPLYTPYAIDNLLHSHRNIRHTLASSLLDFHPRPLANTLEDTFSWFKQHGHLT